MKIDEEKKTIHYNDFEVTLVINYMEHVVEQKDRKYWRFIPEVTVKNKARKTL